MIQKISDTNYTIESKSDPQKLYHITFNKFKKRWDCGCLGFLKWKKCKHQTEFIDFLQEHLQSLHP